MQTLAWHAMESDAVLLALDSDPRSGLSPEEAGHRLERHGPNELTQARKATGWAILFRQFKNLLIAVLIIATILSAAIGEYVEAGIILAIVAFSAVLGFAQEYRAERALEALKDMLAHTITVLRGGREQEASSRDLVPGDVLVLEAGDRIPADCRLLAVHSLQCDEAALTGESVPVAKALAPRQADAPIGDRKNMVFAGTTVTYGRGKAVVCSTAMQTEFGKIAREVAAVQTARTPLERRTAEIGGWLAAVTLGIAGLVIVVSLARDISSGTFGYQSALGMTMFAVALAVAAVPEALAAIVTGALAIGMREMAKQNALVRKMPAVETLGCISVICSDKTGTLTKGEMTVRKLYASGRMLEVSGIGYSPDKGAIGTDAMDSGLALLLKGGLLASDAALEEAAGRWTVRGDPTEGALLALAAKAGYAAAETRAICPRLEEFPFSAERKRMTTVHAMEDGRRVAFMKGAPEVVLERCAALHDGVRAKALEPLERARILAASEDMGRNALRVLALSCKELPAEGAYETAAVENAMVFLGLVGMMDPPREEAILAVRRCREVHIRPVMITGDHSVTAVAVAREIGIFGEGDVVLTGAELAQMDDPALAAVVERVTVYARVSPSDKLKIVRAWKAKGHVVAMTGDGVNDAPALKHADIGIAMGITGTDVAKEAAAIVLRDDNFATIVVAIERGRWIYDNIQKYLTYLMRANITEVVVLGGVVLALGPAYLPLLPAAILYINLATDGLPALALGVSPADPDIMRRPPRNPAESVFSFEVRTLILFGVAVECPLFLWAFLAHVDDLQSARTWVFMMFVIVELTLALAFRSLRYSLLQAPPHKWLVLALVWEAALIAFLMQFDAVRESFGIALPSAPQIAIVMALAAGVLLSVEIVKSALRARALRLRKV